MQGARFVPPLDGSILAFIACVGLIYLLYVPHLNGAISLADMEA